MSSTRLRPEGEVGRTVRLAFDEFGWTSVETEAKREQVPVEGLLSQAAGHYDRQLSTRRFSLRVPATAREQRGDQRVLELRLPNGVWKKLDAEASRQGLPVERLLEHAALFYLADLERRSATRESEDAADPA